MSASAAECIPQPESADVVFLAQVRTFLAEALTPELRDAGRRTTGVYSDIKAGKVWHRRLFERGWIAPAWPREWGGTGWTPCQRFLFDRECALADSPVLFNGGVRSLGPLLIEMGSRQQKTRYLPPILSGDDLWCQGFSEPGAGSDLAAISTRADRHSDHYRINGSKIWTTGAHIANRMFALVRTADRERPQDGLTFLLVDMDSPGLTVSPILGLNGEHEFNQVFFDDVLVPTPQRVGSENDGWSVARRLMQLARSNNTPAALLRRASRKSAAVIASVGGEAQSALRFRHAELEAKLDALEQLELSALRSGRPAADDQKISSMLKLFGTELHQKITELAVEAAGPEVTPRVGAASALPQAGDWIMSKYLAVRAATIYSGTSEIHRSVIARHLGLVGG